MGRVGCTKLQFGETECNYSGTRKWEIMNSSPAFLPFFLQEGGKPWKKKKEGKRGEVRMIPCYEITLQLFATTYLNSS